MCSQVHTFRSALNFDVVLVAAWAGKSFSAFRLLCRKCAALSVNHCLRALTTASTGFGITVGVLTVGCSFGFGISASVVFSDANEDIIVSTFESSSSSSGWANDIKGTSSPLEPLPHKLNQLPTGFTNATNIKWTPSILGLPDDLEIVSIILFSQP